MQWATTRAAARGGHDMRHWGWAAFGMIVMSGCGDSGGEDSSQEPPQGRVAIEAWLAGGDYLSWHCEAAVHKSRTPSPHGFNRICSNDAIAAHASGTADWPEGAAAVKELYASETATTPVGYAVYYKAADDSAGGANWYWYERVPLDSDAPHDATTGVVADGMGDSGNAFDICVGCHKGAGSDALHTPTAGGRDQVYTPVK
ncbi:MAG: hypothetical protein U1F43_23095 [Myxococcota bacterium]